MHCQQRSRIQLLLAVVNNWFILAKAPCLKNIQMANKNILIQLLKKTTSHKKISVGEMI